MSEFRVLVVDDNDAFADSLAQLLRARGYVARCASDGLEALASVEGFDPDCVILDLRMPRMNGADFARRLRERDASVVIVVVSGAQNLGVESEQLQSVDHWLEKPLDLRAFDIIFPDLSRPPIA